MRNTPAKKGRFSSQVFGREDTSVNRLSIYAWDRIWYFLRKNEKPPSRVLIRGLEISVGKLKEIGRNFVVQGRPDPRNIEVFPEPYTYEDGEVNEAHAYIKGKLPKTMATEQIPKACTPYDPP